VCTPLGAEVRVDVEKHDWHTALFIATVHPTMASVPWSFRLPLPSKIRIVFMRPDVDVSATASNADGSATDEAKVEETEDPGNINILPAFRWWCEKGLGANIDQVAKEFSRWRR